MCGQQLAPRYLVWAISKRNPYDMSNCLETEDRRARDPAKKRPEVPQPRAVHLPHH